MPDDPQPDVPPAGGDDEEVLDLEAALPSRAQDDDPSLDLDEGHVPDSVEAPPPSTVPYQTDKVRAQIARALIAILAVVILFAFLTLWVTSPTVDDLEKLMTIIFGPLVALVSGAIGYYFGGKTDDS